MYFCRSWIVLLLAIVCGGCYGPSVPIPPVGFTSEDLDKKNVGFIMLGTQLRDTYKPVNCDMVVVTLDKPDPATAGKALLQIRGPQDANEQLGLLARELPPGRYGITEIGCVSFNNHSPRYHLSAGAAGEFAWFDVGRGEVLDMGVLILDFTRSPKKGQLFDLDPKPDGMSAVVYIQDFPGGFLERHARSDIKDKLKKGRLQSRIQAQPSAVR